MGRILGGIGAGRGGLVGRPAEGSRAIRARPGAQRCQRQAGREYGKRDGGDGRGVETASELPFWKLSVVAMGAAGQPGKSSFRGFLWTLAAP